MLHGITTRIELDVMQAAELREATELAVTHKFPALVVHPDIVIDAVFHRGRRQGRFKIIVPIDHRGERKGIAKLQNVHVDALSQDGFEILLTDNLAPPHIGNEMKQLMSFISDRFPPTTEVRFILDVTSRKQETWEAACEAMASIKAPSLIRTDRNTKVQQAPGSIQSHNNVISIIRKHTPHKIKVSGNIGSAKALASIKCDRYAMSLKQVEAVLSEFRKDDGRIKKLFEQPFAEPEAESVVNANS